MLGTSIRSFTPCASMLRKSPTVTRVVDYLFAGVFSAFALKILTAQAK